MIALLSLSCELGQLSLQLNEYITQEQKCIVYWTLKKVVLGVSEIDMKKTFLQNNAFFGFLILIFASFTSSEITWDSQHVSKRLDSGC